MRKLIMLIISVSVILLLSACSNVENDKTSVDATATPQPQPVKLKLGVNSIISDDQLKQYITDPVQKVYPHISIERVNTQEKGATIAELVAAGSVPDIYMTFILSLYSEVTSLGLGTNIEPLIKKHNVDVSRIKPEYLDSIKAVTELNHYIGLPLYDNTFALFYNKDLFNRFGVPYPKDGMSWDEVHELSLKLNRNDNGTQYYGLWPDGVYRGAYQASLPFVDLKNDKAVFQTQPWKDLFQLWYKLHDVPGVGPLPKTANTFKNFTDGKIAMASGYSGQLKTLAALKDFNWDIVTYPYNKVAPGVGQRVDTLVMNITSTSKNQEDAMRVLSVLLSNEVQKDLSRNSLASVLKDPSVQNEYTKATPELQSKNVLAFTKMKAADLKPFGYIAAKSGTAALVITAFDSLMYGGKDLNTVLREVDEIMTQRIAETIQYKK